MLIGILMMVKLFCYNLFFRPWLTEDLFKKNNKNLIDFPNKFYLLKKTINKVGSIFYFLAIDNYIY